LGSQVAAPRVTAPPKRWRWAALEHDFIAFHNKIPW